MFIDEAGFYPLRRVVRIDAPKRETPVLSPWLTRAHFSVIGGVTPQGKCYFQVRDAAIKEPRVVCFLKHLLHHVPGPITVLWDRARINRCRAVQDFLADLPRGRLEVELLPAYAPALNPQEGIWGHLGRVELKNVCSQSIAALRQELRKATRRYSKRSMSFSDVLNNSVCIRTLCKISNKIL
jgi:transposase